MKWFKHDSDASNDAKLRKLRHKYGSNGYAIYWYCLELVAGNVEKHNLPFELEHDAELIADDFKLSTELVEEMMRYMVNLGLFENNEGFITCLKMASRTDEYTQKLIKNQGIVGTLSGQTPRKSELIEEKRTEQKRKTKRFTPPSVSDVKDYCETRSNTVDPESFHDFYESKGWMVGKNKMKDWKAAVRTWEKKDLEQPKEKVEWN